MRKLEQPNPRLKRRGFGCINKANQTLSFI